jgi:hypothetical protein
MESVREKMSLVKENLKPSFLAAWFVSGSLTVLLPLIIFGTARLSNNNQDEDDNNNNNNNDDENGNVCSWWQWSCRRNINNDDQDGNNNDEDDENSAPWWWFWGENERGGAEEESNGALVFAYVWSLLVFSGIMAYGYYSYRRGADLNGVVASLIVFCQFSFISMFFLGGMEGGVEVEGKELEENGFYGQLPVLMFMTSLFWTIFSLVFAIVVRRMARHDGVEVIDVVPSDYQIHSHDSEDKPGRAV